MPLKPPFDYCEPENHKIKIDRKYHNFFYDAIYYTLGSYQKMSQHITVYLFMTISSRTFNMREI